MSASKPHSELFATVREGLNPRGHHRLCRVNVPTEFSSECNCAYAETEREHAALDSIEEQLEATQEALLHISLWPVTAVRNREGLEVVKEIARAALNPAREPSDV